MRPVQGLPRETTYEAGHKQRTSLNVTSWVWLALKPAEMSRCRSASAIRPWHSRQGVRYVQRSATVARTRAMSAPQCPLYGQVFTCRQASKSGVRPDQLHASRVYTGEDDRDWMPTGRGARWGCEVAVAGIPSGRGAVGARSDCPCTIIGAISACSSDRISETVTGDMPDQRTCYGARVSSAGSDVQA